MKMKWMIWIIICILFLAGCAVQESEPTLTVMAEDDVQPQPTMTKVPSITDRATVVPSDAEGGLTIVEYPMLLKESVEEVLAAFDGADWNTISSRPYEVQLGEDLISYREEAMPVGDESDDVFLQHVEVALFINDEPLMTLPIGTIRASSNVYGIYSDGSSWYLEVDKGEAFYDEDGILVVPTLGDIYRDGESLNESEGYDESFGFYIINGRPFYFFKQDDAFGYSFNGVEYPLPYTKISHHLCCGGYLVNPRGSEDSVAIFANKGDQQYLVIFNHQ